MSSAIPTTSSPDKHETDGPARSEGKQSGSAAPSDPPPAQSPAPKPLPRGSQPRRLSPGSQSQLKNSANRQCVSGDSGNGSSPSFGTCDASYAYSWKLRPIDDNAFQLVNRANGFCLGAPNVNNYFAGLATCGYGADQWRIASTTTAGQTLENTAYGNCLEISQTFMGEHVMVTTCNSDDPKQLWSGG